MDDFGMGGRGRYDGGEEEVCGVGLPVEPVEFFEDWDSAANGDSRVDVVVCREFGWKVEF